MLIGIWAWGIPIARLFYDACLLEFGLGRAGSLRKHFFRPLISARRAPIACLFSDACLFGSRHAGHPSHATSIARLKKNASSHFAAFFEIYKIFILLHLSHLKISAKDRPNFCRNENEISFFIRVFRWILRFFGEILMKIYRNFTEIIRKWQNVLRFCEKVRQKFGKC